jgi:hypothetical protein
VNQAYYQRRVRPHQALGNLSYRIDPYAARLAALIDNGQPIAGTTTPG